MLTIRRWIGPVLKTRIINATLHSARSVTCLSDSNSKQKTSRFSGKNGLILLSGLTILIVASVFVSISLLHQRPPASNSSTNNPSANQQAPTVPTIFMCRSNCTSQKFPLPILVDLTDGMNRSEAVNVAKKTFEAALKEAKYAVQYAQETSEGTWTVRFRWGYTGEPLGHWFEAIVNPLDRTIVYDHCK